MAIYKYMSPDVGAIFLKNWSVAFMQPTHFNDPFDCLPGLFTRTEEERRVRIEDLTKKKQERGLDEKAARGISERWANWEEGDLHGQVGSMISGGIFFVSCFTRTRNHPLMWSHYAKAHTGLLIGFREDCELLQGRLNPVVYSDERPSVALFKDGVNVSDIFDNVAKKFSLVKGLEWAYEQESRIVLRAQEAQQLLDFSNHDSRVPRLVTLQESDVEVIVFGCRFDRQVMKASAELLAKNSSTQHIKIFQAQPDQHDFKLNYVPISEALERKILPHPC